MKIWQVDSFSDKPFKGNPAAVMILEKDISDKLKQDIAMEMNLSETAFVVINNGKSEIRWFTPGAEVDLCGHATLAAAHILWTEGFISENEIRLDSKSGALTVSKNSIGYTLDFPLQPSIEKPENANQVSAILGMTPKYVGANQFICVAELEEAKQVRDATPDLEKVEKLQEFGLAITAKSDDTAYDYIYRTFFPKLSVPEDPVTGAANTALAPYWSKQLGKETLSAYQASARGGTLTLEVLNERVLISGKAKTILSGNLNI